MDYFSSSCTNAFDDLHKRLLERSINSPVYNTKVKCYADGTFNYCYSDYPIFNRSQGRKLDSDFWGSDSFKYANCFYRNKRLADIQRYLRDKLFTNVITPYFKSVDNYLLFMKNQRLYDKQQIHDSLVRDGLIDSTHFLNNLRSVLRDDKLKLARDNIFDLVISNSWDYFFTGTIDPKKLDSSDPKVVKKPLQKWLNNMNERYGLSYLLIFERHKKTDGIHIHGVIKSSVPLRLKDSGTRSYFGFKKPMRDSTALKHGLDIDKGRIVYNLSTWRFGWSTAIKVYGSRGALSNYITKYITKENEKIMGRYYWHSRDLARPKTYYFNSDFDSLSFPEYHGLKYFYDSADNHTPVNYHYEDGYLCIDLDDDDTDFTEWTDIL